MPSRFALTGVVLLTLIVVNLELNVIRIEDNVKILDRYAIDLRLHVYNFQSN